VERSANGNGNGHNAKSCYFPMRFDRGTAFMNSSATARDPKQKWSHQEADNFVGVAECPILSARAGTHDPSIPYGNCSLVHPTSVVVRRRQFQLCRLTTASHMVVLTQKIFCFCKAVEMEKLIGSRSCIHQALFVHSSGASRNLACSSRSCMTRSRSNFLDNLY
jgi:hypothetical protein